MSIVDINFEHYKLNFTIITIIKPISFKIWKVKLNLIHLFLTKTNHFFKLIMIKIYPLHFAVQN